MWKLFFDICYLFSYLLPTKKLRSTFREIKLFDYKAKLNAIFTKYPKLKQEKLTLKKGGGSLAFIFANKYVFKVRKYMQEDISASDRFIREKRITDAIAPVLKIQVPRIEIIKIGKYLFYKTHFIPGKNLVDLPFEKIYENREKLGKQLAEIIRSLHNAEFPELKDLNPQKSDKNIGLVHTDMCSNILVNPDTMDITGIIDWEYATFGSLKHEFIGICRVRKKMRIANVAIEAMWEYYNPTK